MKRLLLFVCIASYTIATACTPSPTHEAHVQDKVSTAETKRTTEEEQVVQTRIVNITVDQYQEKKAQFPDVVLIDARTPEEFAQGHIPGAINIDVKNANFSQEIQKLDPQKTYLVNCKTGIRSMRACKTMQEGGFKSLYNLEGGILAWQNAGLEVEK